uniref:UDP-glycosyltransferase n=1 Tax=Polygala tenuifolia TaxID=355332 RepID=A0A4P2X5X8_9FABA|nr:UDP-glycosyltransferase [Polygala tenuifolia]
MELENARENYVQRKKGKRVLLFPLSIQGHLNPMLQLGDILYSNGFDITVIHTKFNTPNKANYPNFSFHSIPDGLLPSEANADRVIRLIIRLNHTCGNPLREALSKILSQDTEGNIACLIIDVDWWITHPIADSFNLPVISLRTSSIFSFLVFAAFPTLRSQGYFPIQESRLEERTEIPYLKVKDIPMIYTSTYEEVYAFTVNMIKSSRLSKAIVWNTAEALEEESYPQVLREWDNPQYILGPYMKLFPSTTSSLLQHDRSCITWLDEQSPNSVLYVSFGSIVQIQQREFLEVAWGLVNSGQTFLWVIRQNAIIGAEWHEILPDNFIENLGGRGKIVGWCPQQEVLAHPAVGGFWSHCGWNSTLEGISLGVPFLCTPMQGDQFVDSRYVSDVYKAGVHLEGKFERTEIARAVQRLLVEKEGDEMRKRAKDLKEKIEFEMKPGGSAHRAQEELANLIMSFTK